MSKKVFPIILFLLAAAITAYAVTYIVYNEVTHITGANAAEVTEVIFICVVFDVVLAVIGIKGMFGHRTVLFDHDETFDWAVKYVNEISPLPKNPYYTAEWIQKLKSERTQKIFERYESVKRESMRDSTEIIAGIIVFVMLCSIAVGMFCWQRHELNKYENADYIKTVAVARYVSLDGGKQREVMYVYTDEDGTEYILTNVGHAVVGDGNDKYVVPPALGSKLTVFYPKGKPAAATSIEDVRMLTVGATLFLAFAVLVLIISVFQHNNAVTHSAFGSAFSAVSLTYVIGTGSAYSIGFMDTITSGVVTYFMMSFAICCVPIAMYGYVKLARELYYYCKYRKYKAALPQTNKDLA